MARRKKRPAVSLEGAAADAERRVRLAAALRDNLLKRKAQKRGRAEAAREAGQAGPEPADGQPLEGGPEVK